MNRDEILTKLGAISSAIRKHEIALFEIFLKELPEGAELAKAMEGAADEYTERVCAILLQSKDS